MGKKNDNGDKPLVVLVLQGGGALGAYHIGAYQAMVEAGYAPDWVTGISIGAVNAALIVGNKREDQVKQLESFWHAISRPAGLEAYTQLGLPERAANSFSAMEALCFGQPNFFRPRFPPPFFAPAGSPQATSFYDTSPLRQALEDHTDFNRINSGTTRLSLGATQLRTGNLVFFDNTVETILPEHVMASGSLPPGFPAVTIGGEAYWDGGCVANSPLTAVLNHRPERHTLVFMIDLWCPDGPLPRTLDDVLWRQKQIQFATRTSEHLQAASAKINLRHAVDRLAERVPASSAPPVGPAHDTCAHPHKFDFVHVTYHHTEDEVSQSDAEFSRPSLARRQAAGYADLRHALAEAPWNTRPASAQAVLHSVRNRCISSQVPT